MTGQRSGLGSVGWLYREGVGYDPVSKDVNPAPAPTTDEGWLVEGLRVLLVDRGVVAASELPYDDIGWDVVVGEEWLALDNVLAAVWPPSRMTEECYLEAVRVAVALSGGTWNPEPDEDATPEQYVDRWLRH